MEGCGGVITEATTREELLARGWKPEAVDEVLAYRDRLAARRAPPVTEGDIIVFANPEADA